MRTKVEIAAPPPPRPAPPPPPANGVPAERLPIEMNMPKQQLQPAPSRAEAPKLYPPKIAKSIIEITREIDPVKKAGYNNFHKYNYQKWEDILEALGPLIATKGLIIIQSEIAHGGFAGDLIEITYNFTIVNEDGDVWPDRPEITAICKVRDAKGVLDDKAASKCHTQAHKYAMVQLFKIRVADMADHDAGDRPKQAVRRPPAPDGKMAPHYIQTVEGETARSWATKFIGFIVKAASVDEIDQWDKLNTALLDMCQEKAPAIYNEIVGAMTERAASFAPPADHTTTQKVRDDGFPRDKPIAQAADTANSNLGEIPIALDRQLTEDQRDWLVSLRDAFKTCTTLEEIASEQDSLMMPAQATVSTYAWNRAIDLIDQHIQRIQETT